jgi:hypothetical protein
MKLVVANRQHYERSERGGRATSPKCVRLVINSCRIIGEEILKRQPGDRFMEFTDERESSLETDKVSRWILTLAACMIVLGTAFAVLDWYGLIPPLPAAADASSTHATVTKGMSDGVGFVRL